MYDVAIIGCGVIGASIAYTLSQYDLRILILERENDVAMGTTKANSAIVHAGYDPEPGTLMARLNVQGSARMEQLCSDLSVAYKRVGSLVLAFGRRTKKHLRGCTKTACKTVCRAWLCSPGRRHARWNRRCPAKSPARCMHRPPRL